MITDLTAAPDDAFTRRLDDIEQRPDAPESQAAVGRLAQLLHDVGCGCGDKHAAESRYWRPIAFVATTHLLGGAS